MNPSDKDEAERGRRFLEKLLMQSEWDTFNALSDEEVESLRRSLPHGDRPVPGADEMMARALRKLAEDTGDGVTVNATSDGARDVTSATTKGVTSATTKGVTSATAKGVTSATAKGVTSATAKDGKAVPRLADRRTRLGWRWAGWAAAAIVVVGVGMGAGIFERSRDDTGSGHITGAAPSKAEAKALRDEAIGACDARKWDQCAEKLDRAQQIDPGGESEPRVQSARRAVSAAASPMSTVGDPNGTAKPPPKP